MTCLTAAVQPSQANQLEAEQILTNAEGKVASWLEKKNEFETELKKIKVYDKLSTDHNFMTYVAEQILNERKMDEDDRFGVSLPSDIEERGMMKRLEEEKDNGDAVMDERRRIKEDENINNNNWNSASSVISEIEIEMIKRLSRVRGSGVEENSSGD